MFFDSFSENNMKNKNDDDRRDVISRFHHHYLQQQQHQQQQNKKECLSDEVDSARSSGEIQKPKTDVEQNVEKALVVINSGGDGGAGDGATVEVAKRRRGRPPGSKNKPKPPVVITQEADPLASMRPHVLEIPAGHDVVESLARFSRRRNLGICILAGTGAVANVSLRQPHFAGAPPPPNASAAATSIGFQGRFEILSISASFFPPAMAAFSTGISGEMSITLAGPQGQIVGGTVTGPLMATGTVVIVAAAFSNPTFHRLPVEDLSMSVSVSGGVGEPEEHHHQHQQQEHRPRRNQGPAATTMSAPETCGMSIYSGHLSSEVIWMPTARPPLPPPF
ncbi:AT-hook motif nuclear-localized protein 17-like [Musa acuminata AAA Group]|uniref:AT-hook motif nuclear-localized protein 17-like n=1 Tax=Musa acuminata AAA Group TaxID=214697 RepID=UPI0031DCDEB2